PFPRSLVTPHPRSTLFPYTTLFRSSEYDVARFAIEYFSDDGNPDNDENLIPKGNNTLRQRMVQTSSPYTKLCLNIESLSWLCQRSEEHTSELQSRFDLVCRLLLAKK